MTAEEITKRDGLAYDYMTSINGHNSVAYDFIKGWNACSEEKDRRIRELSDELVKCEKTFGLIWQIFGTLENAHCDDLRHLVDNIDIDLPLIQARIKDTLNPT